MQCTSELVIGTNYGVGQMLVTPMALLMTSLAVSSAAGTAMVSERVLHALLGVTVGLGIAVVLSSIDDRAHLARVHAERLEQQGGR